MTTTCIGQPVSWLKLELLAAGEEAEPGLVAHVEACPACAACLTRIREDRRSLPPLDAVPRARAWWRSWAPAGGAVAVAAALLLIVLAGDRDPGPDRARTDRLGLKGGGELVLDLVRERGDDVTHGPDTFRDGDAFKVVVTCPDGADVTPGVRVFQGGETFTPLAPGRITCGNRVVLPGAFRLTGEADALVCVTVEHELACVRLRREAASP